MSWVMEIEAGRFGAPEDSFDVWFPVAFKIFKSIQRIKKKTTHTRRLIFCNSNFINVAHVILMR